MEVSKKMLRKINNLIKTMVNNSNYRKTINLVEKDVSAYGLNQDKRDEELIVSLTSFPDRFDKLHLVIKSILRQTMKPDKVILYLDDTVSKKRYDLPNSLEELKKYGVQIEFRGVNMKPHKKYYYAMSEHPSSTIITIDDDIIYPKDMISELYRVHKKFPDCVVASRSHKILFDETGSIKKYNDWEWMCDSEEEPSMQLLATGCGGVLYPPHCMDKRLFDIPLLMKLSPNADDLWLKVMQVLAHTAVVNCNQEIRKKRVVVDGSQNESLNSSNVHQNKNDEYMKNLIEYFGLTKKDFVEDN